VRGIAKPHEACGHVLQAHGRKYMGVFRGGGPGGELFCKKVPPRTILYQNTPASVGLAAQEGGDFEIFFGLGRALIYYAQV